MNDDLPELETRRKIYNLIVKNPGLHALRIAELLNISSQLADYHLLYLERNDIVQAVKEAGYRRYYLKGVIGSENRRTLSLLRQEVPLRIILYLLKNKTGQHKEINKEIDIAASTLSYHLKKLVKYNVLDFSYTGDEKLYFIKNRKEIIQLILEYKPHTLIEKFRDLWIDFGWE